MRYAAASLAILVAVASTSPVRAQVDNGEMVVAFLKEADADRDGVVTKAEADAFVDKTRRDKREESQKAWGDLLAFAGFPADAQEIPGKDYAVSLERTLKAADADKDGAVSAPERAAYLKTLQEGPAKKIVTDVFASLDADGDGSISKEESGAMVEGVKSAGNIALKTITEAAQRQADTERVLFKMMAESNGDAEGRIRIADFEKTPAASKN